MKKVKLNLFHRVMGHTCHHCPICSYARKKPESKIGKVLHHPAHANNCPAWKSEKEMFEGK